MKVTLLALTLASVSTMSASIIFYAESAGAQFSHLGGTTVETFDSLNPGALGPYTSSIGNYSPGGAVVGANIWGGSNNTNYMAVGQESGGSSYSLTFGGAQSYFGFYWLAMDAANQVQFYNGSTLVASFSSSDISAILSSAYLGNPNTSTDPAEKFAFIGFLSDNTATNFTSVAFNSLNPGTGFETDSHTILAGSGVIASATPEPSTLAMMVPALGALAVAARRRYVRN